MGPGRSADLPGDGDGVATRLARLSSLGRLGRPLRPGLHHAAPAAGAGTKVAIGPLLILAPLAGVAGGLGLSQLTQSGSDTAAPTRPVLDPSANAALPVHGGATTEPAPSNGSDPSATRPQPTADADAVAGKVVPGGGEYQQRHRPGQGAGTGHHPAEDGLIVTNNHVIRRCHLIVVTDADTGSATEAKVVGTAKDQDLAVIQLQEARVWTWSDR